MTTSVEPERHGPGPSCPLCPRLKAFRDEQRAAAPDWFNAPVPSWGPPSARVLIVGLAPGLRGANRTGRPFTGDFAGEILYPALARHGLARGTYGARVDDGFELVGCRITNAVRCVPPANRPTPAEIATCRQFLAVEIGSEAPPAIILALGRIAHDSVVRAAGGSPTRLPFRHGAVQTLPDGRLLVSSFHTSRYNVNTGLLTAEMFDAVVAELARLLHDLPAISAVA